MIRLRISAILIATLIVVAAKGISLDAQTTTETSPSASSRSVAISLSIAVPIKQVPMGQKAWISLTVTNLGSETIAYPPERVYVEGSHGEPPTTRLQRASTHRLRSGESEIRPTGFQSFIAPGSPLTIKYDLSAYYEFKEPGKYSVYIEVLDRSAANAKTKTDTDYWVRSPVATFEVLPPTK